MRTSNRRSIAPVSPVATWLLRTAFGYAVLLGVSLWLPTGLHRVVMGRRGWWHWTASYAALAVGAAVWGGTGRHVVGIVALLAGGAWWFSLLVGDVFTMWSWRWPFSNSISAQLGKLNGRFRLLESAGMLLVVALATRLLAHLS